MLVGLMIDEEIGRCERDWFTRTVVGLLATGVRVVRLLPEGQPEDPRVALMPHFTYRPTGLPWSVSASIRELSASLKSARPEVLHAIGPGSWSAAMTLARQLERPAALSVWSRQEARTVHRYASAAELGAVFAASEALGREAARVVPRDLVQIAPIGVYVAPEAHHILAQIEFSVAVILAGRGAPYAAIESVIDGFSMAAPDFRQVTIFADLDEAVKARAWRRAGERSVRGQFSLIPDVLEHRELVLSASVLLIPAPLGRCNSFLLQAMAMPMATIAVRDPYVEILKDDAAATIIDRPEPAAWATALRRLLSDPQAARDRAESARRIIAEHYSMPVQSDLLAATYDRMLTGGNVPIEPRRSS